ncbi:MAG TPA: peptide chain release factor N(5)-glutamine methyltransferase [Blastocatellia bacterium]|nr:peptide chain release factor N(5)-glutamine methyltransferase [Blastocatellia bacterium]
MPTISEAIAAGARQLQSSSVDEARRTAGVLLCHLLGIDRTHLLTKSDQQIEEPDYQSYLQLIERRATGEPLQYITGHQEFYGLDFIVTPAVLIPRPETEFLVEQVIKLSGESHLIAPLIVDVGTGSGCIAVAIATSRPNAKIIATDVSTAALAVAQKNAERNSVGQRIEFLEGNLLEPLFGRGLELSVDILASNPPYVEEGRPELVQREVHDWEPHTALFGGADGLNFYRRLLADGLKYVKPGGYLVCEIGYTQLDVISDMIAGPSWELIEAISDLQGIPRTLTVRKVSGST